VVLLENFRHVYVWPNRKIGTVPKYSSGLSVSSAPAVSDGIKYIVCLKPVKFYTN
jgi:hypothetical protein